MSGKIDIAERFLTMAGNLLAGDIAANLPAARDVLHLVIKYLKEEIEEQKKEKPEVVKEDEKVVDFWTITGWLRRNKKVIREGTAYIHGGNVAKWCRDHGIPIQEVKDERYGKVNTYPEYVLDDYFANGAGKEDLV